MASNAARAEIKRDKLQLTLILVVFLAAFGMVFKPIQKVSDEQFVPVYYTFRFDQGFGERQRVRQQIKAELQDAFTDHDIPADTSLSFVSTTELKFKVSIVDQGKVDEYGKSLAMLCDDVLGTKYGKYKAIPPDASGFPDEPLAKIGPYGIFKPKPHVKLGLDLQGGVHLVLKARTQNVQFEYQLATNAKDLIAALDAADKANPLDVTGAPAEPAAGEAPVDKPADGEATADAAKPADGEATADAEKPAETAQPADAEKPAETAQPADAKPETSPDGGEPIRMAQADDAPAGDEATGDEAAADEEAPVETETSSEEAAQLADEALIERVEARLDGIVAGLKREYGDRIGDVYSEVVSSNVVVFRTYVEPGPGSQDVVGGHARIIDGALKQSFAQTRALSAPTVNDIDVAKAMGDVRRIIEERVDGLGVSEAAVREQGTDRVVVEMPGIKDPEEAIAILGTTARMEFRKVPEQFEVVNDQIGGASDVRFTVDGKTVPDELVYYQAPEFGQSKNIMVGADLAKGSVQVTFDQEGQPAISLGLNKEATRRFDQFASENKDKWLAIYLDRKCIDARVLKESRYGGQVLLTGGFETTKDATNLKILLDAGALPVPVDVVEQRTVSATLGADSVRQSSRAALAGLALILLFMIALYRLPGATAAVALLGYCLLTMAALVAFDAALTLPGILGLVLSIGMAVDANVIVFERLKEEMRENDAPMLGAFIKRSYERAWSAILDGNVTTLIIGIILFAKGTGPIRGFAVTLMIGIACSMFTALVVTRKLQNLSAHHAFGNNRALYRK